MVTRAMGKKKTAAGRDGYSKATIERTHRLTDMPQSEIVRRSVVRDEIDPMLLNRPA
jgi:hypothetical protein